LKIWIGLAGLKPRPKQKDFRRFGKGKGAYVQVAAWAASPAEFEERVRKAAADLNCVLVELDDVGLLEIAIEKEDAPEHLADMLKTAEAHPADAVFGDFHIWHKDDAN
jgi:hypothetical protein